MALARHGLLALASALALAACHKQAPPPAPPPPDVGVVTLQTSPATLTAELPGRVAAFETSEVRPQVSGVLQKRLFEEGSRVHQGQLLYVIQDAPYRAAVATAEGQLASAQSNINATRLQAQRYQQLVGINAVSRQEVDNAVAASQQASANVSAQRGALQSAEVNLGFTRIRAPISGTIGRSLVTVGALVQAGQADPLATIQRLDKVYVDVSQSATELLNLRDALAAGNVTRAAPITARVQLILPNGTIYPIEGTLQFADVTVEQTTGTVTLRATFPNPRRLLLPGMYVRAQIVEGIARNAIMAPQQGISHDERGRATALVVDANNKVQQRIVSLDRAVGDKWIVSSGLNAGDRLIVEGLLGLKPGTVVHPRAPSAVALPAASASGPGQATGANDTVQNGTAPAGGSTSTPDAAPGTSKVGTRN